MSGRTYCKHEIVQWGYIALVCIALAFTSITRAAAGTKPSDHRLGFQTTSKWDVCLANKVGKAPDERMCEERRDFTKHEPINSVFGSAFVNTGLNPNGGSSLLAPRHERYAD